MSAAIDIDHCKFFAVIYGQPFPFNYYQFKSRTRLTIVLIHNFSTKKLTKAQD